MPVCHKLDEDFWSRFLASVKSKCSAIAFENWFTPIKVLKASADDLVIEVPNVFVKNYILDNYKEELSEFLPCTPSGEPAIEFVIARSEKKNRAYKPTKPKREKKKRVKLNLNEKYRFENFIEGPSNQFVKSVAMCVVSQESSYNPLFIHGGVGIGKTHLLQAVGHLSYEQNLDLKVHYISTESFINELVDNLRTKSVDKMKRFYRSLDLLLIDDIQFLQNRLSFEEEICSTFEAIINNGKKIVIVGDMPPSHLKLSERIIARMECGLVVNIPSPDFETRVSILEHKAHQKQLPLTSKMACFIAENICGNVRQLEGAINRLSAHSHLLDQEITQVFVENALKEMLNYKSYLSKRISSVHILRVVAKFFQIKTYDIKGNSRKKEIATPRQIAMYLSKEIVDEPLSTMGRSFCRTHSTIVHAHRKIKEKMAIDQELFNQIDAIKRDIEH